MAHGLTTLGIGAERRRRPGPPGDHQRRRRRRRARCSRPRCCSALVIALAGARRPARRRLGRRLGRCSPTDSASFLAGQYAPGPPRAGIFNALRGTFWIGVFTVLSFPLGIAAAIYLEEYAPPQLVHELHQRQHPQPVRRPVGRLRHLRAHDPRRALRGLHRRRDADLRRHHDRRARAADRDHHLGRGHAGRARAPSARAAFGLGATRWEVIRTPGPALRRPRHPHRHRAGPRPGPRRGGPAAARRRRRRAARPTATAFFDPGQLTSPFTALPIAITDWAKRPLELRASSSCRPPPSS